VEYFETNKAEDNATRVHAMQRHIKEFATARKPNAPILNLGNQITEFRIMRKLVD
jgi:hypothetical protein